MTLSQLEQMVNRADDALARTPEAKHHANNIRRASVARDKWQRAMKYEQVLETELKELQQRYAEAIDAKIAAAEAAELAWKLSDESGVEYKATPAWQLSKTLHDAYQAAHDAEQAAARRSA